MAAARYNPPPNWPTPPEGWTPPPGWQPDPSWGPVPESWQLWLTEKPQGNWFYRHKVLAGIGAFVLLMIVIGSFTGGGDNDATGQNAAQATADGANEAERAAVEAEAKAAAEAEAAAKAEADRVAAEQKAEAERVAAEARAAEAAAKMDPASYNTIASRDYALIAKDPDAHAGERYVVYGHVTQFDSATGPDAFLASTDAVEHGQWYEYDVNTLVLAEDPAILAPVVENDLVKMFVEVVGSFSYDTQIGGNTTVPQVTVRMIEVIGSTD
jgi:hypothetical protein